MEHPTESAISSTRPPSSASRITLEDFIEAATRGVLRALEVQNQGQAPQITKALATDALVVPPRGRIIIGIVREPE